MGGINPQWEHLKEGWGQILLHQRLYTHKNRIHEV